MNKIIYIPSGEKGSINELSKRALDEPDNLVFEICDKPTVCLNVISNLEQYAGAEIALSFAKKIINIKK